MNLSSAIQRTINCRIAQLAFLLLISFVHAENDTEINTIASEALRKPKLPSKNTPVTNGCHFPGAPAHSTVDFSDDTLGPGSVATYYCEPGFELLGPSRRVCNGGVWVPEGIPFCVLNVAAGKAPMQISTDEGGIPQKAIDGSTSSFFNGDTCSLTKSERVPWWYVNLLEPYMVQLVRLDFGKSCCGSNKPATLVVRVGNNRPDLGSNPICNRFTGFLEEGQPLFLPCNPPMPGAFVSVHLEVPSPMQLSICEAFVYTDQALPIERCPQFRDQPPGSTATYNGKCYIFYNRQPMKFRDALAFCRSRGGTLVDESNPALQGFISWELWRRHRSDTNSQYWMGAVRDPKERTNWKWINGDDVTVSFWNLPGGNDDCARYDGTKGWLWSDTNCNLNLNYICQHQPKACGRPEQPPNSTMSAPHFNVGANVEYTCDDGHLLVGPTTRTCLDTGFYNEFPPVCKHIQCGYPADIRNGVYTLINNSVGYLSNVVYECSEGFEMIGRAQLTCDIDERWNGPPPRCEPIHCEPPFPLENGKFITTGNESVFGNVVEYQCIQGYKLIGAKKLTCLATGQYDNVPPTCKSFETTPTFTAPPKTTSRRPSSRPTSTTRGQRPNRPVVVVSSSTFKPIVVSTNTVDNTGLPGTVREDTNQKQKPINQFKPTTTGTSSGTSPGTSGTTTGTAGTTNGGDNSYTGSAYVPNVVLAPNAPENEIPNSGRQDEVNVNFPTSIDAERRDPYSARLNLGAIIALGVFGGFVFLAAIISTVIILIKRNQSAKHYRHRASPDCNTVASFDSSSSGSHNGLNRYYRQAWENLHESAATKMNGSNVPSRRISAISATGGNPAPLRRSETLDEPSFNARHHSRDHSVDDVLPSEREKKRHHHHHHHHGDVRNGASNGVGKEWSGPSKNINSRRTSREHELRKY